MKTIEPISQTIESLREMAGILSRVKIEVIWEKDIVTIKGEDVDIDSSSTQEQIFDEKTFKGVVGEAVCQNGHKYITSMSRGVIQGFFVREAKSPEDWSRRGRLCCVRRLLNMVRNGEIELLP